MAAQWLQLPLDFAPMQHLSELHHYSSSTAFFLAPRECVGAYVHGERREGCSADLPGGRTGITDAIVITERTKGSNSASENPRRGTGKETQGKGCSKG
jgi:hypothetical protein